MKKQIAAIIVLLSLVGLSQSVFADTSEREIPACPFCRSDSSGSASEQQAPTKAALQQATPSNDTVVQKKKKNNKKTMVCSDEDYGC